MLQTLLDSCAALGVPLTAAQAEKLCDFGARLLEQNRVMNLTAITEPQAVAKLHFADCLALLRIVPFSGRRVIARLGGRVEKTETYDIDGAPRCVIVIRKEHPTPPAYPRRYAKIKQSPL